jgi:hypothetical protein
LIATGKEWATSRGACAESGRQCKTASPIDGIKAERQKSADQIARREGQFEEAQERLRKKCVFQPLDQLKEYKKLVDETEAAMTSALSAMEAREKKVYTRDDVDAFDSQLSAWVELKQKAAAYEKYLSDKAERDGLAAQYDALTAEIETLRTRRKTVLSDIKLGVNGLEIGEYNQLYHNGAVRGITESQKSCNWSTAESVQVFFGLGARFAGELKVLCVDNAESLDKKNTGVITAWAEKAGFLIILLRVAEIPESLEEWIIYVKEGEVLIAAKELDGGKKC